MWVTPEEHMKTLPTRGIFNSTDKWTEEKAKLDTTLWGNPNNTWVVDNKYYDLAAFV